jgi:RimJ/RimL family protein N-acetyltransferase
LLTTKRLILRPWQEADRDAVAAIFADPQVMRFFTGTRDRAQSDAWVDRTVAHFHRNGFGLWAVEARNVAPFIGFVGLSEVPADIPCAPAVEAVWTLGQPFWNRGYASEAAQAAMQDGFERHGLAEIVAFTAEVNTPSRAVMERLGMVHDRNGDFDHPRVTAGNRLRRHVLYRLPRPRS